MGEDDEPTARFEAERGSLRAIAIRMLGSAGEAEDAVQETWVRLNRVDPTTVDNLPGWLRTTLTRLCLDQLRSRRSRGEVTADVEVPVPDRGPEDEALLADDVSRALLAVLDALDPAERIAVVLHDMFAVPFDEIGPLVARSPATTKKLASRARQKVRGRPAVPAAELARRRRVVSAFLAAARAGDLEAVLGVLDPDVVRYADPAALPAGVAPVVHGADAVAAGTMTLGRRALDADVALVDGTVGVVVAPGGRLALVLTFQIDRDRITRYDVIADPARLRAVEIAVLDPISAPGDRPG